MRKMLYVIALGLGIWGCAQIGSIVGKMLTQSTGDLGKVSVMVQHVQNLYPADSKTTEAKYMGKNWREGETMLAVIGFKRDGLGMWKLDGTLTANGDTMEYFTNGVFGSYVDKDKPVDVTIETSEGNYAEFTVTPVEPVTIKSINGGSNEIDLTKDLILEFDVNEMVKNKNIQISLMVDLLGTRSKMPVAYVTEAKKVIIPNEIFKHLGFWYGPNKGDNYLIAERYYINPENISDAGATQIASYYQDWKKVTVMGEVEGYSFAPATYSLEVDDDNEVKIEIVKQNALYSPPISRPKTFAMASFVVRATKLYQRRVKTTTSTSTSVSGNIKTTTTTITTITKTRKFPQLPDEVWNNYLDSTYANITKILEKHLHYNTIPLEQVMQSENYANLDAVPDCVSVVEVSKSYKGTRRLLNTSPDDFKFEMSSTFATDRPMSRLIRELGVDAILAITIDLEMPWFEEVDDIKLSPRLAIKLFGPTNGPNIMTEHLSMVISGPGLPLEKNPNPNNFEEFLRTTSQIDALVRALNHGFVRTREIEREWKYDDIWALKTQDDF